MILALSLLCVASATPVVFELGLSTQPTLAEQFAAQVCSGLMNRDSESTGAYALTNSRDVDWLKDMGITQYSTVSTTDFITGCITKLPATVQGGCLLYNATKQQVIIPNLVTLAGALNAIPVDVDSPALVKACSSSQIVFDATKTFADLSVRDVTAFVFDNYGNTTTTIAFMNPGYSTNKDPFNPALTGTPNLKLVDFLVSKRIFNFFLNEACVPLTADHKLMERMNENSPFWPKPLRVYGYNDAFAVSGDLFEAETTCAKEHNMGQIASTGVSNLGFFTRAAHVTKPMTQVASPPSVAYNASKIYLTMVIGDGDNVAYLQSSRRDWMQQRVAKCAGDKAATCYPLSWTLSPHVTHLAPLWMQWFYNQTYATQRDYFLLPPSGDLYSYPAMMTEEMQAQFVANTEADCRLLNTSGVVDWEWFTEWGAAFKTFYPKYASNSQVAGVFPVNVPFMFPTLQFSKDEFVRVLDASDKTDGPARSRRVAVFKPREWRGTQGKAQEIFSKLEYLTVAEMADEIHGYPAGSLHYIYLTSDGGASLDTLNQLVEQLDDDRVTIVNHEQLTDLAFEKFQ